MRRHCWILLAAMMCASPVNGQAPAVDGCDCFALTAWTKDSGLPPGNILAMTQDRDGYLWLGMNRQLVRFDGWQFDVWGSRGEPNLPGSFVSALVSARDGSIWVGFGDVDTVTQVSGERLTNHSVADGVPLGPIAALLEDRDGAIWAGGRGGLSVFRGGKWTPVLLRERSRDAEVTSLFETDEGAMLVGTSEGVFRIRPESTNSKYLPGTPPSVQSMAQDESGDVWVTDSRRIVRPLDDSLLVRYAEEVDVPSSGWRLLRDRYGTMWIAGLGGGLFRVDTSRGVRHQFVERFAYEQKFPDGRAGGARSLLVDRDDNVWVGMRAGGLLRISRTPLQSAIPLEGLTNDGVRGLAVSPDGSVWVATGRNLNRFIGTDRTVYDLQQISTLHSDGEGRLWIVTPAGIGTFANGRLSTLDLPAEIRFGRIISVAVDPAGDLWLCSNEQGAFRWAEDGGLTSFDAESAVAGQPCTFLLVDGRGRVWMGLAAGGVALFQNGRFRRYGEAEGLARGSVSAILEDSRGSIWISTVFGLSRFQSGRFVTIGPSHGLPGQLAPGLVEDSEGYLWISVNSGSGAIRLNPAEVDRISAGGDQQIRYTLYDETDGFLGELFRLTRPAAVRAADGGLWFLSGHSVVMFDPTKLRPRGEVGPARVARAVVNGRQVSPENGATLPARISSLRVEFAAADLSAASKLRFRYRLDGVTEGWVDAGSRYAEFTNLEPGEYHFRVATLSGAQQDPDETVWEFSVGQLFYRTTPFYVLVGCGVAGMLGATWWLRLRVMRQQFALVLAERVRISREIHDVLIQNMVAIGFELEWLAGEYEQPTRESPSQVLRALRKRIRTSVNEARQSILELRSGHLESQGLVEALEEHIESVRSHTRSQISLTIEGDRRKSPAVVEEQIMRIAVEAISNALRHARASAIDVVLTYSPGDLSLVVSDDGCGFAPDEIDRLAGQHWGLQSMGERSSRLGGNLEIRTGRGQGTTIKVKAPVTYDAE